MTENNEAYSPHFNEYAVIMSPKEVYSNPEAVFFEELSSAKIYAEKLASGFPGATVAICKIVHTVKTTVSPPKWWPDDMPG